MDDMTRSNVPMIDLTAALDPSSLAWWIEWNYSDNATAIDLLLKRFVTFTDVTVNGIHDDFTCGHAADFAHALKQAANALDETRTRIKKPVLHAQRMIDGEAKKLADRVASAVREVETRVTAYLRTKEAEARAAAEAEAARLQAEAERLAAEALRVDGVITAETAVDALEAAQRADELANAKALELTRTRGVGGALTALKDNWVAELVDITKVPAAYLQLNDSVVKAAIKSGVRDIPGIRIWNDAKAFVR